MIRPVIRGVYIADVRGIVSRRDSKHCVCVSISDKKYLLINTFHGEIYDDFLLPLSRYDFLIDRDRYLSCAAVVEIPDGNLKSFVGMLSAEDTYTAAGKILRSKTMRSAEKNRIALGLKDELDRLNGQDR
jgi:hypothetical protein